MGLTPLVYLPYHVTNISRLISGANLVLLNAFHTSRHVGMSSLEQAYLSWISYCHSTVCHGVHSSFILPADTVAKAGFLIDINEAEVSSILGGHVSQTD